MNEHLINIHSKKRQGGVALAVSLILLTVITLLSLSAMRGANLNSKIAVNHQHKQFAFQAAESALSNLLNTSGDDMSSIKVPKTESDDPEPNVDLFAATSVDNNATVSADVEMDLIEISPPGKYKFSGFGLNVVTVIYQADSVGEVDGTNATGHNRMHVALIRE